MFSARSGSGEKANIAFHFFFKSPRYTFWCCSYLCRSACKFAEHCAKSCIYLGIKTTPQLSVLLVLSHFPVRVCTESIKEHVSQLSCYRLVPASFPTLVFLSVSFNYYTRCKQGWLNSARDRCCEYDLKLHKNTYWRAH